MIKPIKVSVQLPFTQCFLGTCSHLHRATPEQEERMKAQFAKEDECLAYGHKYIVDGHGEDEPRGIECSCCGEYWSVKA